MAFLKKKKKKKKKRPTWYLRLLKEERGCVGVKGWSRKAQCKWRK